MRLYVNILRHPGERETETGREETPETVGDENGKNRKEWMRGNWIPQPPSQPWPSKPLTPAKIDVSYHGFATNHSDNVFPSLSSFRGCIRRKDCVTYSAWHYNDIEKLRPGKYLHETAGSFYDRSRSGNVCTWYYSAKLLPLPSLEK